MFSADKRSGIDWNPDLQFFKKTAQLTLAGGGDEVARLAAKMERIACSRETRG